MARPRKKLEDAHRCTVAARFTKAERVRLEQMAGAYGLTLSELIRRRALGTKLPPAATDQDRFAKATSALLRLGVNLNQIALRANIKDSVPMDHLYELIVRINEKMDELDESH